LGQEPATDLLRWLIRVLLSRRDASGSVVVANGVRVRQ